MGGPFEPHTGDALRLLPDRRRVVQAADPHDRRARRRRHDVVLDVVRHRGRVGPSGRRGLAPGGETGRRCRMPTATRRRDRAELPGRMERAAPAPRPLPDVRGRHAPATRRARRASGTPRRATRAAGSSGRSTCRRTPAARSRCRSRTSATGRPRAWACSSTTSWCRPVRARPRSRPATLGGWEITGQPPGSSAQPEQLHLHDGGRIPGGRGGDAGLAAVRLRVRGHLRCHHSSRTGWAARWITCSTDRYRGPWSEPDHGPPPAGRPRA